MRRIEKNDESETEGKKFVEEALILGKEKEEEEYEVGWGGYKYGKTCVEALPDVRKRGRKVEY